MQFIEFIQDMHIINIRNVDLNLLVVADALYRHQNVSHAANELGLTQSAVSHALARLREHFRDPLFVRVARGVKPTERAREIRVDLEDLIRRAQALIAPPARFDPKTARGRLTLSTNDFFEVVIMPKLHAELRKEAPHLQLSVRPTRGELPKRDLEDGTVDLAVAGFYENLPEGFYQTKLHTYPFAVAAAKSNSKYGATLTADEYFEARHALITLQGDFRDDVIRKVGKKTQRREILYGTYSFTSLAWILQETDLLLTAPRPLIRKYAEFFPLKIWEPPVETGTMNMRMVWHAQTHENELRTWFRAKLKRAYASLDEHEKRP